MRALILVVIGLVVGAFATHMVQRTLRMRHAYPRAVMDIMQHHFVAMHKETEAGKCPAGTTRGHLQSMLGVSREIGPAFGTDDPHFNDLANRLRDALQQASTVTPDNCKGLAAALTTIHGHCDDCHREYR